VPHPAVAGARADLPVDVHVGRPVEVTGVVEAGTARQHQARSDTGADVEGEAAARERRRLRPVALEDVRPAAGLDALLQRHAVGDHALGAEGVGACSPRTAGR
jgi:hypothetical protein